MRIAYVEDNPTNLALVERVVSMGQHKITSYTEGEIAVQALTREKFDLILMDIELAGDISGLQVVKDLRAFGLRTPIVAVTAYAMLGDRDKCLEAGCDDYLPKPIPIMDLVQLLARYDALVAEKRKTDEIKKRKTDELKASMSATAPAAEVKPSDSEVKSPLPDPGDLPLTPEVKPLSVEVKASTNLTAPTATEAKPLSIEIKPSETVVPNHNEVKVPEPIVQKTDDLKSLPNTP